MNTWCQVININVFWHCKIFILKILFKEPYNLMFLKSTILHNSFFNEFCALM